MTKTPDPIQELVTAARRKQILDAATQVFAEKGFHRATIKDIARMAGIADGTIYTYFASKTEVLLGILHRLNESTEREQVRRWGGSCRRPTNLAKCVYIDLNPAATSIVHAASRRGRPH